MSAMLKIAWNCHAPFCSISTTRSSSRLGRRGHSGNALSPPSTTGSGQSRRQSCSGHRSGHDRIMGRSGAAQILAPPHRRCPPPHRRHRLCRARGDRPSGAAQAIGHALADAYNALRGPSAWFPPAGAAGWRPDMPAGRLSRTPRPSSRYNRLTSLWLTIQPSRRSRT